jgi:exosome complex component CSL4
VQVVISECFRPGDLIRAEVLSLGTMRDYYLTTAKNELGVIWARSLAGAPLVAVSWEEMRCPVTNQTEKRKVAKL